MITIYWHCLGMIEADKTFVANKLNELAQFLREKIKLPVTIKALTDERELAKEVDERLNQLSNQSYTFSVCACDIGSILPIEARLFVYCDEGSNIAKASRKQAPWAKWGATCNSLTAAYPPEDKLNSKFNIWHESVHLLLRRADDLDECYKPYPPYEKKDDCNCDNCIMRYEPNEKWDGELSMCDKIIGFLKELSNKEMDSRLRGNDN